MTPVVGLTRALVRASELVTRVARVAAVARLALLAPRLGGGGQLLLGEQWEGHGEDRSAPEARLHGDPAAMRLGNPLADRQSQPEAAALARAGAGAIGAPEAVEHVRQVG